MSYETSPPARIRRLARCTTALQCHNTQTAPPRDVMQRTANPQSKLQLLELRLDNGRAGDVPYGG